METSIREWTVKAPWGKLSLTSWGNTTGLPVFLAHGRQDCSATFQPVLQRLPREYHYVGIDMPGSGNSDHLPVGKNSAIVFVPLEQNLNMYNQHIETDSDSFNSDFIMGFSQISDDTPSTLPTSSSQDINKDLIAHLEDLKFAQTAANFENLSLDPRKYNNEYRNGDRKKSDYIFQCTGLGNDGIGPSGLNESFEYDPIYIDSESKWVTFDEDLDEFVLPHSPNSVESEEAKIYDVIPKIMVANSPYHFDTGIRQRRPKPDIAEFIECMENSDENPRRRDWIPDCLKCCLPCKNKPDFDIEIFELPYPKIDIRLRYYREPGNSMPMPIISPLFIHFKGHKGLYTNDNGSFTVPDTDIFNGQEEVVYDEVEFDEREYYDFGLPYWNVDSGPRQSPEQSVKIMRFHFLGAMEVAIEHLGWDKFIFIGHSMGCEIGLFFNTIYPKRITKMIFFDAEPTLRRLQVHDLAVYQTTFYDNYYNNYNRDNYHYKTYTIPQATQALMKARNLTEDKASIIVSKSLIHVKDDQYRFTWGHRLKLPAPQNYLNSYYFALFSNIPPTILISASESLNANTKYSPGALELIGMMETLKNFTHVEVKGDHDVHLSHPDRVAPYVIDFLNKKNVVYSKL